MNTIEVARAEDCAIGYDMINMGREFQKERGFVQWTDEYPNQDTIYHDIQQKTTENWSMINHSDLGRY